MTYKYKGALPSRRIKSRDPGVTLMRLYHKPQVVPSKKGKTPYVRKPKNIDIIGE
jgi:hypothetical protein